MNTLPKKKKSAIAGQIDLEERAINLKAFFESGFEQKEWINVTELPLPAKLKYLGMENFSARFGDTMRYSFETSDGQEARLLCKGQTFFNGIEKFVSIGTIIELYKTEKGYWQFQFPE